MADVIEVGWGAGEAIAGTPFRQLVTTAATEGRVSVLSAEMPPGLHVDEHVHADEDQITIVVSGVVGCTIGERAYRLSAGSVLFMPRGMPHAQWNDGPEPARIIELYTPGGFERVFEQAGRLAGAGQQASGAAYAAARGAGA